MTPPPTAGRRPIVVVDGGARRGLALLAPLHARLALHAFEPDAVACAALDAAPHPYASLRTHRTALAATTGTATLHVARKPSLSSLLEPDLVAYRRHFGRMYDFPRWVRAIETVETRTVATVSLDDWADRTGIAFVDLLKLDTQGTELDILRGAARLIAEGRIGLIHTEVSFLPVYKGQQLFTDLDRHLRAAGYAYLDCRFYPDAVRPPPATRRYVEPPRWGIGGDATYASATSGSTEAERQDRACVTADVLAHLGLPGASRNWLRTHAGLDAQTAEAAVAGLEAGRRVGWRVRFADAWVPAALRARSHVG